MKIDELLRKISLYEERAYIYLQASDPFSFFQVPEDESSASDHGTQRAFERSPDYRKAQLALDFINNVIAQLYRHHATLIYQLPEGSTWWLPAPGNLIAILRKANNQLVHTTFLPPNSPIPKKVDGNLEQEIRRLSTR